MKNLMIAACFLTITTSHAGTSSGVYPFQDGSLCVTEEGLAFPYLPFLGSVPVWAPALPQYDGQPVELVRPLPGLGGSLSIGLTQDGGTAEFLETELRMVTADSAQLRLVSGNRDFSFSVYSSPGHKGVTLESPPIEGKATFLFEIQATPRNLIWATPHKKDRRDWGSPKWEWRDDLNAMVQAYSTPLEATLSMTTAIWFSDSVKPKSEFDVDPSGMTEPILRVTVPVESGGNFRFGFLHADNRLSIEKSIEEAQKETKDDASDKWSSWLTGCRDRIVSTIRGESNQPRQLSEGDGEVLERELVWCRNLFLSNGMVMPSPMLPGRFPYSLRQQGIALEFWDDMGLVFPFREEWKELVRHHPVVERTIPITRFTKGNLREVIRSNPIVVTAPDPNAPPTQEEFDILLGYVIDGGNVTLVDGYTGFEDKEGWWRETGASDPADYALRMLKAPVDFDSRRTLDEEGLSPTQNTFALGMDPVEISSSTYETIRFTAEGGRVLFVCAKNELDRKGLTIKGGAIGDHVFQALTPSESEILSSSHQPELGWDKEGNIEGRLLRGEAFITYRLPAGPSVPCELRIRGEPAIYVGSSTPETEHFLLKKVVQAWYHRALLTLPISRSAHPAVYSGTYTCRVFDVTGTEVSPILFHNVGRGSLAWVGLPVDYIRKGSDGGTDAQRSLREDPCYDLIRMTLAVHDPRQAGAQQAGATPRWYWSDKLNVRTKEPSKPEHLLFAWDSIRQLGSGAGNDTFWGWAFASFVEALSNLRKDSETVEGTPFVTTTIDGAPAVDFYRQATRYAMYRDIEGAASNLERTWHKKHAHSRAEELSEAISTHFHIASATPWAAAKVEDGTLTSMIRLDKVFKPTALAVTLIDGEQFPGGEEVRQKYWEQLLENSPSNPSDMESALLSILDANHRRDHLDRVFNGDSRVEPVHDIATRVSALYGLCLAALEVE